MNGQTWSTIGVIFGILFGAVTIYFLARSSSNETKRRSDEARDKAVDKAVTDAKADMQVIIDGHLATIATQEATNTRLYGRLDAKDRRIEELEDQLRAANARGTT